MLGTIAITLSLAARPSVDVSVEGQGYLQFADSGHALYTSSAHLTVVDGWLSNPNGAPLLPTLRVPQDTIHVEVDEDGNVFASTPAYRGRVGQISLAMFGPYTDLRPLGSYLVSSQMPVMATPGNGAAGTIHVLKPGESAPMTVAPQPEPLPIEPLPAANDPFVLAWTHRDALAILRLEAQQSAPPHGPATIYVRVDSEAPNDHFTLGDIATIDASEDLKRALAGAQLGDTPVIGKKLSLSRKAIIDALGKLGFDTSDFNLRLPRSAEVHRSSQPLPADSISKVAIAAAGPILGQDAELRAEVVAPDVAVPLGKIELYAETCVQTQSGATVIVVTKINGSRYDSHVVRVIVDRVARSHS